MKKLLLILLAILFSFMQVQASEIPDVKDSLLYRTKHYDIFEITYPIRNNALVVILQPCPDNSGDFMFTISNKKYKTNLY